MARVLRHLLDQAPVDKMNAALVGEDASRDQCLIFVQRVGVAAGSSALLLSGGRRAADMAPYDVKSKWNQIQHIRVVE